MKQTNIRGTGDNSQKACIWDKFTNQYNLSKTLRFELRPVGKTKENIKNKVNLAGLNLIREDEARAKDYKKIKKIIDDYHKEFIEKALGQVEFKQEVLKNFYETYEKIKKSKRDKNDKRAKDLGEELAKKQKNFRAQVRKQIKSVDGFEDLFSENLIKKRLIEWIENKNYDDLEEKKELIRKFENWTTYFKGFHENRKNVYSEEEIPTSIIYRIIHDNLPKFLDNLSKFQELKFKKGLDFGNIEKELKEQLAGKRLEEIFSLGYFNSCLNQSGIDNFNVILGGIAEKNSKEKIKGVNEYVNQFSQKKGDKKIRSLKMAPLFKQILSDRESASFVLDKFEDDKDLIDSINIFYKTLNNNEKGDNSFKKIKTLLENLKNFSLEKIYVKNDRSMTDISQFLYGDYNFIAQALEHYCREEIHPPKKTEKPTKTEDKLIDDWVKNTVYFSIYDLENALKKYNEYRNEENKSICDYFRRFENKECNVLKDVGLKYDDAKSILERDYEDGKKDLVKKSSDSQKIKAFLDSILGLFQFIRPLYISSKQNTSGKNKTADVFDKDGDFYLVFDEVF